MLYYVIMTVTAEKYITINYKFTTPDGLLLGTSDRQGPLTFCAGSGDIISGLDARLQGHEAGEELSFVIPAEEAYGVRDESLVKTIKKSELPAEPKIGTRIDAEIGGRWRVALISEIKGEDVVLDANHPLAGVPLHFDCSIVSVEDEPPFVEHGCGCGGGGCGCGGH